MNYIPHFNNRYATRTNYLNAKHQTYSSRLIIFFSHSFFAFLVIHCVETLRSVKRASCALSLIASVFSFSCNTL